MDWIIKIKNCFETGRVFYTNHAKKEMEYEELGRIYENEVYESICNGGIIKEYPEDKPYPSTLIFGKTEMGRPLHVVCAYNEEDSLTIVITVYQPNPVLWLEYRRRREN